MRFWLGVSDNSWFKFLSTSGLDEVWEEQNGTLMQLLHVLKKGLA